MPPCSGLTLSLELPERERPRLIERAVEGGAVTGFERLIRIADQLGKVAEGSAIAGETIHEALGRTGPALAYTSDETAAGTLGEGGKGLTPTASASSNGAVCASDPLSYHLALTWALRFPQPDWSPPSATRLAPPPPSQPVPARLGGSSLVPLRNRRRGP